MLFCDCVWSVKCMCALFANDCVMVYGLCCLLWVVVRVCACVCACKKSLCDVFVSFGVMLYGLDVLRCLCVLLLLLRT